jgi:hypothetical protein
MWGLEKCRQGVHFLPYAIKELAQDTSMSRNYVQWLISNDFCKSEGHPRLNQYRHLLLTWTLEESLLRWWELNYHYLVLIQGTRTTLEYERSRRLTWRFNGCVWGYVLSGDGRLNRNSLILNCAIWWLDNHFRGIDTWLGGNGTKSW